MIVGTCIAHKVKSGFKSPRGMDALPGKQGQSQDGFTDGGKKQTPEKKRWGSWFRTNALKPRNLRGGV